MATFLQLKSLTLVNLDLSHTFGVVSEADRNDVHPDAIVRIAGNAGVWCDLGAGEQRRTIVYGVSEQTAARIALAMAAIVSADSEPKIYALRVLVEDAENSTGPYAHETPKLRWFHQR